MNYAEKLKDPRWQKKRLEIMKRDGWKCVVCGKNTETLNVHHAEYIFGRNPWEYSNENLLTLCEPCHEIWHEEKHNPYISAVYRLWVLVEMLNDRIQELPVQGRKSAMMDLAAIMKTMGLDELEYDWKTRQDLGEDEVEFLPIPYAKKTVYKLVQVKEEVAP